MKVRLETPDGDIYVETSLVSAIGPSAPHTQIVHADGLPSGYYPTIFRSGQMVRLITCVGGAQYQIFDWATNMRKLLEPEVQVSAQ